MPSPTLALLDRLSGENLVDGLMLMAVGMLVVFAALVLLLIAIVVINRVGERVAAPKAPAPGGLSPQTVAVLTAAATAALKRPVRVTEARRLGDDRPGEPRE